MIELIWKCRIRNKIEKEKKGTKDEKTKTKERYEREMEKKMEKD